VYEGGLRLERIHIVVATNNKYVKHLAVMLTSLFEQTNRPISLYVIDGNLSSENKQKLHNALKSFQVELAFLTVEDSLFQDVVVRYHLSKETYYRIAIPALLPKDVRKVLYLDCDLIVKEDIANLWDVNIEKYHLGAVQIPGKVLRFEELSIPESAGYFNAGVLLINLKKWRDNQTSEKVLHYMRKNPEKLKFMDQDALNAVLHEKWLKLDPKWNYQVHRSHHQRFDPAIIHYTTDKKPWNSWHNPKFKDEYLKYAKKTIWKLD
jgi:lipopolysaccharide biosynthesis glycosyltransferase